MKRKEIEKKTKTKTTQRNKKTQKEPPFDLAIRERENS